MSRQPQDIIQTDFRSGVMQQFKKEQFYSFKFRLLTNYTELHPILCPIFSGVAPLPSMDSVSDVQKYNEWNSI